MRDLLKIEGVRWGACYQEDFGTPYLKPTRLLLNLPQLDTLIVEGAATFDRAGFYTGPLQPRTPRQIL